MNNLQKRPIQPTVTHVTIYPPDNPKCLREPSKRPITCVTIAIVFLIIGCWHATLDAAVSPTYNASSERIFEIVENTYPTLFGTPTNRNPIHTRVIRWRHWTRFTTSFGGTPMGHIAETREYWSAPQIQMTAGPVFNGNYAITRSYPNRLNPAKESIFRDRQRSSYSVDADFSSPVYAAINPPLTYHVWLHVDWNRVYAAGSPTGWNPLQGNSGSRKTRGITFTSWGLRTNFIRLYSPESTTISGHRRTWGPGDGMD